MGQLEGRRALVTGGASGIGLATVKRFIHEGANVVIVDFNEVGGKSAAAETGADFVRADASNAGEVAIAFAEAKHILGGLDVAYMNAGVTIRPADDREPGRAFDIAEMTEEQYRRLMGINVDGVVYGVREAVRLMEPGGSILATASIAGIVPYGADPIYALTKHAVVGLVRGLGSVLREQKGLTLNAILPGITETPLLGPDAARYLKDAGFPLIAPAEIANACVIAITDGGSGNCWVIQAGRDPVNYEFRGAPGPRADGAVGAIPPGLPGISE